MPQYLKVKPGFAKMLGEAPIIMRPKVVAKAMVEKWATESIPYQIFH
jgi:hypothetical protein